ncbi:MAG: hypothetical protein ACK53Y_09600 [bacterium]|jgi:hypothetical protein
MGCCSSKKVKGRDDEGKENTVKVNLGPVTIQENNTKDTSETKDFTYTLGRRKFVEDVTEEELLEQEDEMIKKKHICLTPGPGDMWMEPVE